MKLSEYLTSGKILPSSKGEYHFNTKVKGIIPMKKDVVVLLEFKIV